MSIDPNPERPLNSGTSTFWLWAILGGAMLVLLSWFLRFPWG